MGNGVSRTYPAGILKSAKQVQFGKPEVRQYCQDRWETMPLLNTHETRRIEANIKAAATVPMPKPIVPVQQRPQPVKHKCEGLAVVMCVAGTALTITACALGGPLGLLVPLGFIAAFALIKWAVNRKVVTYEYRQEQLQIAKHLDKLAAKNMKAGLTVRAQVYKDMAAKCRRNATT